MKGADPLTGRPLHDEPRAGAAHAPDSEQYDRDLNVKSILWTGTILAVGTAVVCVLMWGMYRGLSRLERRHDPAPPPLAEERQPQPLPPLPRLQSSPDQDMAAFRAEEDRTLEAPAWIDRQAGTVRLPIDLAMDVLVRRGLPATGAGAPSPAETRLATGAAATTEGQASPLPGQPAAAPPVAKPSATGAGLGARQGGFGPFQDRPAPAAPAGGAKPPQRRPR